MPTANDRVQALRDLARRFGFARDEREAVELAELSSGLLGGYDAIEATQLEPQAPPAREYRAPDPDANPWGAWVHRTSIRERDTGPLAGRTVVLKENIALGGVPMAGGSDFLEGFVPNEDATVVRRVLEAGGEIVGKAACEYLSMSAGSHTSATGPVRNPRNPEHTTGGSSSGCAALVAAGDVDLAIGGDQGGSIRVPSSFCGIVGMKPTFGLVPYTGILSIDGHIDHTGPMTANVADNALLLDVLAGPDGRDPRQRAGREGRVGGYGEAARREAAGLRVAVVDEGFAPVTEPAIERCVRDAGKLLESRGVKLESVSIPDHSKVALAILPFLVLGAWELMRGDGFATHANQPVLDGLPEAFRRWRDHAGDMPVSAKTMLLAGAYAEERNGHLHYAKALRLREWARGVYGRVLEGFDALLMPTAPCTAPRLPAPGASPRELLGASTSGIGNTSQFDITGHPAISVPCGESDGLPVGCMLVGRHLDEATLYRLAAAIEAG